jgi:hypothetical protein
MPGYKLQKRDTARTSQFSFHLPIFLSLPNFPFSVLCVLFVCKFVMYCCRRVSPQLRLNIYIISYLKRQVYNFGSGSCLLGMVSAPVTLVIIQYHSKMRGPYNIKSKSIGLTVKFEVSSLQLRILPCPEISCRTS